MQISSTSNVAVKQIRRLQSDRRARLREGLFVAEGERWLRDVIASGVTPQAIYVRDSAELRLTPLLSQFACPITTVTEAVMRAMSDVSTPPGVLLVMAKPTLPFPEHSTFLLVLDAVQTPGNLGTMLRTASAAGVEGVILAPGCVDPFNPKVVRGTMGALLRLPLLSAEWDTIATQLDGMDVLIASSESELIYADWDWEKRTAIVIGNEANGPSAAAWALGRGVQIPMANQTESLNAAMAAGILMFEGARQRRCAA